jgi:antitoxin CptB
MSEARRLRLERIRWRSRRGLLEMDLVLQKFMARHLESLDETALAAYESLLTEFDTDLLDYVNGRNQPLDLAQQQIVALWQQN